MFPISFRFLNLLIWLYSFVPFLNFVYLHVFPFLLHRLAKSHFFIILYILHNIYYIFYIYYTFLNFQLILPSIFIHLFFSGVISLPFLASFFCSVVPSPTVLYFKITHSLRFFFTLENKHFFKKLQANWLFFAALLFLLISNFIALWPETVSYMYDLGFLNYSEFLCGFYEYSEVSGK